MPETTRVCGWCGVNIAHMRRDARYCTRQHKKNDASKRHRARNPGYYKRYHGSPSRVAWLELNREKVRAAAREQQRRYRAEHPGKARAWWVANAAKHRLYQANRRARKLNNPGSVGISERDWRRMLVIYRGRCTYCGERSDDLHLDHVIPLVRGGRHAIGNAVPACQPCNASKSARRLADWRLRIQRATGARPGHAAGEQAGGHHGKH